VETSSKNRAFPNEIVAVERMGQMVVTPLEELVARRDLIEIELPSVGAVKVWSAAEPELDPYARVKAYLPESPQK
jgi:hypothetical protein